MRTPSHTRKGPMEGMRWYRIGEMPPKEGPYLICVPSLDPEEPKKDGINPLRVLGDWNRKAKAFSVSTGLDAPVTHMPVSRVSHYMKLEDPL